MSATLSKTFFLTGLALLLFAGCALPQGDFQTKKDSSYHKTLGRVLVVSLNEDLAARLGRDFSDRMLARITQSFSAKGVSAEVVHQNKDDLDPAAPVRSAASLFHPGQLLYIAVTRVLTHSDMRPATMNSLPQFASEISIGITFNAVDAQTGKIIWRGTDQFETVPSPEGVADELLKQLETEKLL